MENISIKMLKGFGKFKQDETYEIDSETAQAWVEAGFAEKLAANTADSLVEKFADMIEENNNSLVSKLTDAVAKKVTKLPAVAVEEPENKSFCEYLTLVKDAQSSNSSPDNRALAYNTLNGKYKSTQVVGSGSLGGFLVPPEWRAELFSIDGYPSVVRANATVIPMGSDRVMIPVLDQTATGSSTASAFYAGLFAKWEGELTSSPETNLTFRQVELVANRLTSFVPVSNQLLADSMISVEAILRDLFNKTINQRLEYDFLNGGDGVGKPYSILNSSSYATVPRGSANTVKFPDLAKMMGSLPSSSLANAVWVINQSVLQQIIQLADAANRIIWIGIDGGAKGALNMQLFGRPVYVTENLPVLGTKGDCILADFSAYIIGERQQATIAFSEHVRFLTNQVAFKVEVRIDGQPKYSAPVTLADGTTQISPFVVLN